MNTIRAAISAARSFLDGIAWAIALGATLGFIGYIQIGGH